MQKKGWGHEFIPVFPLFQILLQARNPGASRWTQARLQVWTQCKRMEGVREVTVLKSSSFYCWRFSLIFFYHCADFVVSQEPFIWMLFIFSFQFSTLLWDCPKMFCSSHLCYCSLTVWKIFFVAFCLRFEWRTFKDGQVLMWTSFNQILLKLGNVPGTFQRIIHVFSVLNVCYLYWERMEWWLISEGKKNLNKTFYAETQDSSAICDNIKMLFLDSWFLTEFSQALESSRFFLFSYLFHPGAM